GVLGISMGCARCHDHKFDPITQQDYYALMGVFASTVRVERPTFLVDPKVEQEYMWLQGELFDLAYSINLLGKEGPTFRHGAEKSVKWKAQMEALKKQATMDLAKYPQLVQSLDKYWNPPRRAAAPAAAAAAAAPEPGAAAAPVTPAARAANGRAAGAGGRGRGAGLGAAGAVPPGAN